MRLCSFIILVVMGLKSAMAQDVVPKKINADC